MTKTKIGVISIQGQIGSFSCQAANNMFQSDNFLQRDSFIETFQDLVEDRADVIVVPIENSTFGSIYENYDQLGQHHYPIIYETYVRVDLNLIGFKGAKLDDLKKVYSHQVALGQINRFKKNNPQIEFAPYPDTAGAVEFIKKANDITQAACASRLAAKIHNLDIIKEGIEDNHRNFTRFFAIAKDNSINPNLDINKTTIQFELGSEPGSLYKTLRSFADRDLSLSRIESRPIMNTDWNYRFYLDIVAGLQQDKLKHAIEEMKDYVKDNQVVVLGSYHSDGLLDDYDQ